MKKLNFFTVLIATLMLISCEEKTEYVEVKPSEPANKAPKITSLTRSTGRIITSDDIVTFTASASDADGDELYYTWECSDGGFMEGKANVIVWKPPVLSPQPHAKKCFITAKVTDGEKWDSKTIDMLVYPGKQVDVKQTFYATGDATVFSGGPNACYGGQGGLMVGEVTNNQSSAYGTWQFYVRFDLFDLPSKDKIDITMCKLGLYIGVNTASDLKAAIFVHSAAWDWEEDKISWATKPGVSEKRIAVEWDVQLGETGWISLDIMDYIVLWRKIGTSKFGFRVSAEMHAGYENMLGTFYSKEVSQVVAPSIYVMYDEK